MAVWRRKPPSLVIIHSDQGSQFSSLEWQTFLKTHNLEASMRRLGNCYDNTGKEIMFHLLKSGRLEVKPMLFVRKHAKVYSVIFNYYKTQKRNHSKNAKLSPTENKQ